MISEEKILAKLRKAFPGQGMRLGIGDDTAILAPHRGFETLLTCDWFLEGTHFLRDRHPADAVGWKSLARAVSDIAAMGGRPKCFLLGMALPETMSSNWLDEFLRGLRKASKELDCPLAGGDTTRNSKVLLQITVVGEAREGLAVRRSGAKPGDFIYVSGRLGGAAQGLRQLLKKKTNREIGESLRRHLYPMPRIALGKWLAERRIASSMMDLSDGLSSDLPRLCKESGAGASIRESGIPIQEKASLQDALHGGEDYELLFTASPQNARKIPAAFQGIPISCIGEITKEKMVALKDSKGRLRRLVNQGWDPFRNNK